MQYRLPGFGFLADDEYDAELERRMREAEEFLAAQRRQKEAEERNKFLTPVIAVPAVIIGIGIIAFVAEKVRRR